MFAADAETQAFVYPTIAADQEVIAYIPELPAQMIRSNLPQCQEALLRIEAGRCDRVMDDDQSNRPHEPWQSRRDWHRTPAASGNNLAHGQCKAK